MEAETQMARSLFSREREQRCGKGLKAGKCSVGLKNCQTPLWLDKGEGDSK